MSQNPAIQVVLEGDGVAIITLNQPERRNAMRLEMWEQLSDLLISLEEKEEIRAAILTGAGNHFCAGADISEFEQTRASRKAAERYQEAVDRCQATLFRFSAPMVAAIEGSCVGGGMGLALCCDFRIAAEKARFGITAARLGVTYGLKETRYLAAVAGIGAARDILYRGRVFGVEEARTFGLVDLTVPDGQASTHARQWISEILHGAPISIEAAKRSLNAIAIGEDMMIAGKAVSEITNRAIDSNDYKEGRAAFLEKRKPSFRGV